MLLTGAKPKAKSEFMEFLVEFIPALGDNGLIKPLV